MNITTNNHEREFTYRADVPSAVLANQFDYQDEDCTDGYFQYLGTWYHTDQFMRTTVYDGEFAAWDGYHGESYFSGVLIKLVEDGERFIVARYTS